MHLRADEIRKKKRTAYTILTTFIYLLQFIHSRQGEKLVSCFGTNSQGPTQEKETTASCDRALHQQDVTVKYRWVSTVLSVSSAASMSVVMWSITVRWRRWSHDWSGVAITPGQRNTPLRIKTAWTVVFNNSKKINTVSSLQGFTICKSAPAVVPVLENISHFSRQRLNGAKSALLCYSWSILFTTTFTQAPS